MSDDEFEILMLRVNAIGNELNKAIADGEEAMIRAQAALMAMQVEWYANEQA